VFETVSKPKGTVDAVQATVLFGLETVSSLSTGSTTERSCGNYPEVQENRSPALALTAQ